MKNDPVAWITRKRAPQLESHDLSIWKKRSGYDSWVQEVRTVNLNAMNSFVLWEKTVGANQANADFEQALQAFLANKD